jgi:hypothetical protein
MLSIQFVSTLEEQSAPYASLSVPDDTGKLGKYLWCVRILAVVILKVCPETSKGEREDVFGSRKVGGGGGGS